MFVLLLDEFSLIGDPLLLHLDNFIIGLMLLSLKVSNISFHGALVIITTSLLQLCQLSVESIDLKSSHVDSLVLSFDLILEFFDFLFFFSEFKHKSGLLLPQNFILLKSVKVINLDSGDLIRLLFNGNLLLRDGLINLFSLLQQVG